MARILVIGGGLAGCTASLELTEKGHRVILLEKGDAIGGKVRSFGCKASPDCNQCGLCVAKDVWERVESHPDIEIHLRSQLKDLTGGKGDYSALVREGSKLLKIDRIHAVLLAIGFEQGNNCYGSVEFDRGMPVITGTQLEEALSRRTGEGVFSKPVKSVAFIQCFGSRDQKEKARYCSRVCCGYATRAAQVLRHYDPDMRIAVFYMDLQQVESGDYFGKLHEKKIELIRSKPVKIKGGSPALVLYDRPGGEGLVEEAFDLIVLSEGIHPSGDAAQLSELCALSLDENGFLKTISGDGGVYIAGCASGPKKIAETYADALTVAREIAEQLQVS